MDNNDMADSTEIVEKQPGVDLTINPPTSISPQPDKLISDDKLLGIYENVLDNVKNDREEISDILAKFLDMVMNDGDASSASKEAVVNLVKAKSETNDQVIKIADLMTRIKAKERTLDPAVNRAIHAQQNNIYNIGKSDDDTSNILLEEIEKASTRIRRKR